MRLRPPRLPRLLAGAGAALLLGGGLALTATLGRASREARDGLEDVLQAARLEGDAPPDLARALQALERDEVAEAADVLGRGAEARGDRRSHVLAARAAAAAGALDAAARHAVFARRLSPGDEAAARFAEEAVTRAVLARLAPAARPAAVLGGLLLVLLAADALRRGRRARRRGEWLAALRATIGGAAGTPGGAWRAGPGTADLAVDVFLRTLPGAPPRPPRPGVSLSVVLSHPASNRTVRLTPRRGLREDAARFRLREETLREVLCRPGRWRVQALVDGRPVAEAPLEVRAAPAPARPAPCPAARP